MSKTKNKNKIWQKKKAFKEVNLPTHTGANLELDKFIEANRFDLDNNQNQNKTPLVENVKESQVEINQGEINQNEINANPFVQVKEISQDIQQSIEEIGQQGVQMMQGRDFWGQLNQFKNTFFYILLAWLAGIGVAYYLRDSILKLITWPLGESYRLHFLYPAEGFTYLLKIYAVAGLLIAFPFILGIFWFYIKDALQTNERKFVLLYILSGVFMATFGIVYGFYSLLPTSLQLLLNIQPANTEVILNASEYINFIIALLLVLIVVFQTPILVFSLIKTRLVKPSFFQNRRREIYTFVAILSAIITPTPDVLTMILLMIPIILFFEIALFLGRWGYKELNV